MLDFKVPGRLTADLLRKVYRTIENRDHEFICCAVFDSALGSLDQRWDIREDMHIVLKILDVDLGGTGFCPGRCPQRLVPEGFEDVTFYNSTRAGRDVFARAARLNFLRQLVDAREQQDKGNS